MPHAKGARDAKEGIEERSGKEITEKV